MASTAVMNFTETYTDKYYTWSQWTIQSIFYMIFPRFDLKRLESTLKEDVQSGQMDIPLALHSKLAVSLMKDADCRTHIMEPLDGNSDVTLFFVHGGAYVKNFMPEHFPAAAEIALAIGACICVLPEYSRAPIVDHHALFGSIERVYRQVVARWPDKKIVIMGDSAGGGIALNLAQRLVSAKIRGDTVRQPNGVILMSPWLDISMVDPEHEKFVGVDPFLAVSGLKKAGEMLAGGPSPVEVTHPAVSPLYGPLEGLPPLSVWTGTHDMITPNSRRLRDRYRNEKVAGRFRYHEYGGLLHCYFLFPGSGTPETIQQVKACVIEDCELKRV